LTQAMDRFYYRCNNAYEIT